MSDLALSPGPALVTLKGYAPLVTQSFTADSSLTLKTLRNLFPNQRVVVLNPDGTMTNEWYRAFRFIVDVLLGGVNAIPLADIQAAINFSQNGVTQLQNFAIAQNQQASQFSAALAAAVTSIQAAASPGAPDIPPVPPPINPPIFENGGGD